MAFKKYKAFFFTWLVMVGVILSACTSPTSPVSVNTSIAGYSVEDLIMTNDLGTLNQPAPKFQTEFEATDRIHAVVVTSGDDNGVMGTKWYLNDVLIHEQYGKTVNNQYITYLEGSPLTPLVSGDYRVEATVIAGGALMTKTFKVKDYEVTLNVNPPQPTPKGHIDIENANYAEVPFAFDEVWLLDDSVWVVNEVKIAFFVDRVFFTVVVESDILPDNITEEEAKEIARPIAEYAVRNGYLQRAKEIEVNGVNHEFTDPLTITFFNKEIGGGYRVIFDLNELEAQN